MIKYKCTITYAAGVDPLIMKTFIFGFAATSSMDFAKTLYSGTVNRDV